MDQKLAVFQNHFTKKRRRKKEEEIKSRGATYLAHCTGNLTRSFVANSKVLSHVCIEYRVGQAQKSVLSKETEPMT